MPQCICAQMYSFGQKPSGNYNKKQRYCIHHQLLPCFFRVPDPLLRKYLTLECKVPSSAKVLLPPCWAGAPEQDMGRQPCLQESFPLSLLMGGTKQVSPFHAVPSHPIQESQANEGIAKHGCCVADSQGKHETSTLKTILILYVLKIMMPLE